MNDIIMDCKICSNKSTKVFTGTMLSKYNVSYYRCSKCLFIQTEEPYWLGEAYGSGAIAAMDVGIMSRNLLMVKRTEAILFRLFSDFHDFSGVDYGGGHGVFVRLMRDLGFNFYRQDLYAENIYARYFDIKDFPKGSRYKILTAFEVLEHLVDPIEEIKKMFTYADVLLLSTELQPSNELKEIEKWWYLASEGGQHISFYNKITFYEIASIFKVNYYTDFNNLHILSKKAFSVNPFLKEEDALPYRKKIIQKIVNKIQKQLNFINYKTSIVVKPKSLIMSDFEYVKEELRNHGS